MADNREEPLHGATMRTGRLPEVLLARQSGEPLYEQITRQLAQSIREGKLRSGARLPSTRVLARMLGVSRNTVLIAYENLAAANLILNAQGSGARVNNFAPVTLPPMASVLSAAMYPEIVTLLGDPDGNPFYLRHPDRFRP
jgi:DNA-binding transcriptional regulator YhcF (GntR family)